MKIKEQNFDEIRFLSTYGAVSWVPLTIYRSGHPEEIPGPKTILVRLHNLHIPEMEKLSESGQLEQSYKVTRKGGKWGPIQIRKGAKLFRTSGRPLRSVPELLFVLCEARCYQRYDTEIEDYTCYNVRNIKLPDAVKPGFIDTLITSFQNRVKSLLKLLIKK